VLGSDYSEAAENLTTLPLDTIKEVAGALGVVSEGDGRVRGVWVDALLGAYSDDAPNSIPNSNQPTEPTPSCVAIQEPESEDTESEESEPEHEVQEIVAHRHVDGNIEYRIRWVGFDVADDTWEPRANLLGDVARLMVEQYTADIKDRCVVCLESIGADVRSDPHSFTCVHSSGVCGPCVLRLDRPRSCPLCRDRLVPFESEDEDDGSEDDGSDTVNIWVSNSMGRLFIFTIPTTITINTDEPAVRYHDDTNDFIDTIFDELSFGSDTIRSIVSNNFNSCLWGELSDMTVGHYEYDDV